VSSTGTYSHLARCFQGGHLQYKDETWSDCARSGLAGILQTLTRHKWCFSLLAWFWSSHKHVLHLHCPKTRLCSAPAVKPKKGDALLFFSLHVNATTDTSSLHGSCPVIEGEKWSATKWIHVRSFDNPPDVRTDAPCSDDNELCRKWAAIGECYKNPTYMVGTKDTLGFCRKSCGLCDAWTANNLNVLWGVRSAAIVCIPTRFFLVLTCK